ncbi:hypothetical protein Ami103574_10950 [Aminipila butyrica]|uniref:Uncharacterized protein n=1 Tax=Aminipila butyrica TaxID=433296 RepID=A0A858BW36_9FIRM|nr:hypothetical protein [Aminipila butyrica]QIB69807.1 hypothetical protein Ami103574_10950 [Aminipila butyrica]
MKNKIKSSFKRRELYFVIIVYPAFLYLTHVCELLFSSWANKNYNYYGFTALLVMLLIIIFVFLEVFTKLYGNGIQGDKLKIREKEGLSIGDLNERH